ncbi:cytochrome c biogenesis protein CcdA [Nocardioides sp. BGMRC 2183]|nr:cytochrome c biogenesis protein CcdA [Nocardioides sp. BGMRC 2183]
MQLHAGVEVGLAGAVLGGLLSLLSPCSVMLMPAFFSYAFDDPRQLMARTGTFYLGLVTTLVPLGAFAGALGARLVEHRSTVFTIAAVLLIVLGLCQALALPLPGTGGRTSGPAHGTGSASVYLLGTVYGLAGACTGPLLGSVLTYATFGASWVYGGLLMASFAAGMALPLGVLAWAWRRLPTVRRLVRPRPLTLGPIHTSWTHVVSGALTVAIGVVLLATHGLEDLGGLASVDTQFTLEERAATVTDRISDQVLFGVVLVAVAGALFARTLLTAHRDRREP